MTEPGTDHVPAKGQRLSPLTPLLRGPIVFAAALGAVWQQGLDPSGRRDSLVLVTFALLGGLAYGVATWVRTTYWIGADELRIDTGLLARQSRRIRIDRLQGIDIVQPFLARAVGHAELKFDVAGGDREGVLAFLTMREAVELRELLLRRRDELRASAGAAPGVEAALDPADEGIVRASPPQPARELARLDLRVLAISTVLTPEMLISVAALSMTAALVLGTGSFAVVGGVVPAALAAGVAVVRRVNGFWDHVVSDTESGLQVRRGLLSKVQQTVTLPRVQGVRISEPLLWRSFGWARLDVSVAGSTSSGEQALVSSVLMPAADRRVVDALARHALRGLDPAVVPLTPAAPTARLRAPVSWRWQALGADDQLVVARTGWFVRRTDVVPLARVQSLGLAQGPWLRALGLCDLYVHSPVGSVRVVGRYRDLAQARAELLELIARTRAARQEVRPWVPSDATWVNVEAT